MTKNAWKKRIIACCEEAGTFQPFFEDTIITLADILAERDSIKKKFKEEGSEHTISYTNKAGATNVVKNPLLVEWDDLNGRALTYFEKLGLTPSGYKRIVGEKPKEEEALSGLAAALASIEC